MLNGKVILFTDTGHFLILTLKEWKVESAIWHDQSIGFDPDLITTNKDSLVAVYQLTTVVITFGDKVILK